LREAFEVMAVSISSLRAITRRLERPGGGTLNRFDEALASYERALTEAPMSELRQNRSIETEQRNF
jgi:hypothetical protein